jgi:hypothetical protein
MFGGLSNPDIAALSDVVRPMPQRRSPCARARTCCSPAAPPSCARRRRAHPRARGAPPRAAPHAGAPSAPRAAQSGAPVCPAPRAQRAQPAPTPARPAPPPPLPPPPQDPDYKGSCGTCYEVECVDGWITDGWAPLGAGLGDEEGLALGWGAADRARRRGPVRPSTHPPPLNLPSSSPPPTPPNPPPRSYGQSLDRNGACKKGVSVVVRITDTCPCQVRPGLAAAGQGPGSRVAPAAPACHCRSTQQPLLLPHSCNPLPPPPPAHSPVCRQLLQQQGGGPFCSRGCFRGRSAFGGRNCWGGNPARARAPRPPFGCATDLSPRPPALSPPPPPQQRWCCGDKRHMDMSWTAFDKIADRGKGVVPIRFRKVGGRV